MSSFTEWRTGLATSYTLGSVKVSEVVKMVELAGWTLVRTTGSHRHFKHPEKAGIVTISGNDHKEMPRGTLNNVLKQAGLK